MFELGILQNIPNSDGGNITLTTVTDPSDEWKLY